MLKKVALVLFSAVLIVSCSRGIAVAGESEAIPEMTGESVYGLSEPVDLDEAFSYVFGYMFASSTGIYGDNIDYQYVARGVLDYGSGASFFTQDEMNGIASMYQRERMAQAQQQFDEVSSQNERDAEEFLKVNGQRNGVITTESGLQYEIMERGDGEEADQDSVVTVNYSLTLLDGTLADSSYERGVPSVLDLRNMIEGFREGVSLMRTGDSYRFWIPPELGYGLNAPASIGPNSLLIFDVELLSVEDADE